MYQIVVAINDSPASYKAIKNAITLAQQIKNVKLLFLFAIGLNPPQTLPYIDNLEKSYNMEITESGHAESSKLRDYLKANVSDYDFVEFEGYGQVGPLIEEYISKQVPNINLLIVGTRNNGVVKRWVLGSVSDYLVHHLKAPVMIVKED